MATVNKDFADRLVAMDGKYADDPQIARIVEYTNAWGKLAYGIEYKHEVGRYRASSYVINPRVYWEFKDNQS